MISSVKLGLEGDYYITEHFDERKITTRGAVIWFKNQYTSMQEYSW